MSPQRFGGPIVDTDERRAVVRRLTDALYDYLTLDVVEMERGMNAPAPAPLAIYPKDPEILVKLQEQIEALEGRIEQARAAVEKIPDKGMAGGMAGIFTASVVGPMEDSLRQMKEYRSRVQAEMEKADV